MPRIEYKDLVLCTACCRLHGVPFAIDDDGLPSKLARPGGMCRLCGEAFTGEHAFISREKRALLRERRQVTEKMRQLDEYERAEVPLYGRPTPEKRTRWLRGSIAG